MKKPAKPDQIVAQHNALINARFSFVPLQMRLFLTLLSRIEFDDTDFKEHFVSFSELGFDKRGGSSYEQLALVCKTLPTFTIIIEKLEPVTRRRSKKPNFEVIPLMAKTEYRADEGGVVAIFNPLIMPYLLQLRESGNFTTAALAELHKLQSPYALRIYWLLKEYANFGQRTITLEELRLMLDIADDKYPRFSSFKARVLEPVRKELDATDLPFTFELERQNQIVQKIKFLLKLSENAENAAPTKNIQHTENAEQVGHTPVPGWEQHLLAVGVSKRSVQQISQQLAAGEYPLSYVAFVLERITKQQAVGKVKKPAGAIYKALVDKYLLEEYLAEQQRPPVARKAAAKEVAPEPVTFPLAEVREMYDSPGPFGQDLRADKTFEQYVQQLYLDEGFQLETRDGVEYLVKR